MSADTKVLDFASVAQELKLQAPDTVLNWLDLLPYAVIVADPNMSIAFANHTAEELLGYSRTSLEGRALELLFEENTPIFTLARQAVEYRATARYYELRLPIPRKVPIEADVYVAPVLTDPAREGMVQALICIDDRSNAKRLSTQHETKDMTQSAGVMAAMLAHEVKNPLSGIRGAAQLLQQEANEENTALTQLIVSEVDRIKGLIDQIEIFSGHTAFVPQEINIHEVLRYSVQLAKTGFAKHIQFNERYDPSLPPVAGMHDSLIQLFINLIKNASEAMDGRADATIHINTAYRGGIRVRMPQGQDVHIPPITITIEDNGPGIPEAVRERLFEPAITSKAGGKGLGLAIAAKIVSDHKGLIELDQEFTSGARFMVRLPIFK